MSAAPRAAMRAVIMANSFDYQREGLLPVLKLNFDPVELRAELRDHDKRF